MADILVVTSKVKGLVRSIAGEDFRTGQDFIESLSKAVEEITKQAVQRARASGRRTVKEDDL